MQTPILNPYHPAIKIVLVICLAFVNLALFGFLAQYVVGFWYGLNVDLATYNFEGEEGGGVARIIAIFTQVGGFLLTAITFAKLASFNVSEYFNVKLKAPLKGIGIVVLVYLISIPINGFFGELSTMFQTSDGAVLHEMQEARLQQKLEILVVNSDWMVLFNVFVLAVLPAICEEFLFRGVFLRYFYQATGKLHVGVLISAFWFSLAHFEYQNFLAIMFMGLMLGYIYVYTGSVWWSVLLHCVNNGLAVLAVSYSDFGAESLTKSETNSGGKTMLITGAVFLVVAIALIVYITKKGQWNVMAGSLARD